MDSDVGTRLFLQIADELAKWPIHNGRVRPGSLRRGRCHDVLWGDVDEGGERLLIGCGPVGRPVVVSPSSKETASWVSNDAPVKLVIQESPSAPHRGPGVVSR